MNPTPANLDELFKDWDSKGWSNSMGVESGMKAALVAYFTALVPRKKEETPLIASKFPSVSGYNQAIDDTLKAMREQR